MKKKIGYLFALLCMCQTAMFGQWRVTPEVGVSILKTNMLHSNALAAPRLGVGVDYYFNKQNTGLGIASGLYFYQKKESSSIGELGYQTEDNKHLSGFFQHPEYGEGGTLYQCVFFEFDTRRDYLQLPVLLSYQWKIAERYALSVAAGPYVAVGVGGKHETRQSILEIENQKTSYQETSQSPYDLLRYNRFEVGFASRVSVSADHLVFNLRYETNLNERNMGCDNLISLGVGYKF